jgi:hypothetical protein
MAKLAEHSTLGEKNTGEIWSSVFCKNSGKIIDKGNYIDMHKKL